MRSPKMATNSRFVLFIGHPSDLREVAHWAAMRQWAPEHALELTRTFAAGPLVCAIATEDVLGGICSPSEATTMQKVVSNGVPCVNVWEAPDRILHCLDRLSDTPIR
ncbi:hypothetical protein [Rhodococcus sp. OK302]|uniref:hypothetical protein n=1 Tax=Rhodococcus sp. OK302 TaxID=1882769 RepID=UPI000B943986|nr:hypothetical protein [Rhodococcus sp. OK302]OYD61369.1 hypothetical protein BDB13_6347 [Rhodococcus sp. OK302]